MTFGKIGAFDSSPIQSNLQKFSAQFAKSLQKLSSGNNMIAEEDSFKIGYVERIKSAVSEMALKIRNIRDNIGQLETRQADASLKVDIMHEIKDLAIQHQNDTLTEADKQNLQTQVDELSKLLEEDFEALNGNSRQLTVLKTDVYATDTALSDDIITLKTEISSDNRMFDLSKESILDDIDTELENRIETMSGLGRDIRSAERDIDQLRSSHGLLSKHLTDITATDVASETANLMRAQLQMTMNFQLLDIHQQMESDIITQLLAPIS